MNLDYATLKAEVIKTLENTQLMILATCSNNKVTARNMAIINDELTIMFQTSGVSEKVQQITANPNIALAAGNMQVEAVARVSTNPVETQKFIDKFKAKFPDYYEKYSGMPDEVVVICTPIRFAMYRFIDGKPCTNVLDVNENSAYRLLLK